MFPARDVMSQDAAAVSGDASTYEAITATPDPNVAHLPVVDPDGTLAAILSKKGVLRPACNVVCLAGNLEDCVTEDVLTFSGADVRTDAADGSMKHIFRRVLLVHDGNILSVVARRHVVCCILSGGHAKRRWYADRRARCTMIAVLGLGA